MVAIQPPIPQAPSSANGDWIDVVRPLLLTRLLFVLITLSSARWSALFGLQQLPDAVGDNPIAAHWYRWDAVWYMLVAVDGYSRFPYQAGHINVAFFPLYPGLVYLLLHAWPWSQVMAPIAVSCLCTLLATLSLYRLVRLDFGPTRALRVVWLFALMPTGLFLFAGYAESLFLLCCIRCFYRLRLRHWWQAGMWGSLAALTRPLGIILLAPYAICWAGTHWPQLRSRPWAGDRGEPRHATPPCGHDIAPRGRIGHWSTLQQGTAAYRDRARTVLRSAPAVDLLGALLIPAGLGLYAVYLWARFGDPLLYTTAERGWHRGYALPWLSLWAAVGHLFADLPHLTPTTAYTEQDLVYALVGLALSLVAIRQLPSHYVGYIWAFWLTVLSTPSTLDNFPAPLMSMSRYLLTTFPLLIMLAATGRRTLITACILLPLMVYETAIFVSGNFLA